MQSDAHTGYTDGMRLVDAALQRDHESTLEDWLRERRVRGDSYERIAADLTHLLGVQGYTISHRTARRWCLRLELDKEQEPAS